jgi:TrmH family RNA methyltransferase
VRQITSSDNPHFKRLLKLQQSSRERRKSGLSLLDGAHLLSAYIARAGTPREIVVSRSRAEDPEIAGLVHAAGMEPVVLSDTLFREVSSVTSPTGVIAVVETPRAPTLPREPGPCIMLDDLQDAGNLGSILRAAAAFGMREVYLSKHSVHAWSPRVLRAGMGAHFALSIFEGVDLADRIARHPGRVLATAADGDVPLYAADVTGNVAFLLGNEGSGLSAELRKASHATLSIPMPGRTESLNVAAAAAVCLYERARQMATV